MKNFPKVTARQVRGDPIEPIPVSKHDEPETSTTTVRLVRGGPIKSTPLSKRDETEVPKISARRVRGDPIEAMPVSKSDEKSAEQQLDEWLKADASWRSGKKK